MHTSYLSDAALQEVHLRQTPDIADTVAQALSAFGENAGVCVLPEGPLSIPYVR
jgi:lactate racemase